RLGTRLLGLVEPTADLGGPVVQALLDARPRHLRQHDEEDREGDSPPDDLVPRRQDRIGGFRLLCRLLSEHGECQQMHGDSYVNLMRMKTTKPMSASASVKAMPRNIVVRAIPAASGWRAIAVMALPTTMPMPMPGPTAAAP